jgi:uncharacterized protein (TIGR00369 family)
MTLAELPAVDAAFRPDLRDGIHAMPSAKLLGIEVVGYLPDGVSRIDLPVRPELTFEGRVVQAGYVGALADYAGVSACGCLLPPGWLASTTGFEVHNLAPAVGERLIAIGRKRHLGKSSGVSTVDVYALKGAALTLVCVATTMCRPFEPKG